MNSASGDIGRSGKVVLQLDDDVTLQNTNPCLITINVLFMCVA